MGIILTLFASSSFKLSNIFIFVLCISCYFLIIISISFFVYNFRLQSFTSAFSTNNLIEDYDSNKYEEEIIKQGISNLTHTIDENMNNIDGKVNNFRKGLYVFLLGTIFVILCYIANYFI